MTRHLQPNVNTSQASHSSVWPATGGQTALPRCCSSAAASLRLRSVVPRPGLPGAPAPIAAATGQPCYNRYIYGQNSRQPRRGAMHPPLCHALKLTGWLSLTAARVQRARAAKGTRGLLRPCVHSRLRPGAGSSHRTAVARAASSAAASAGATVALPRRYRGAGTAAALALPHRHAIARDLHPI